MPKAKTTMAVVGIEVRPAAITAVVVEVGTGIAIRLIGQGSGSGIAKIGRRQGYGLLHMSMRIRRDRFGGAMAHSNDKIADPVHMNR